MGMTIRFVDMDGASMPVNHPWGRARRDAIARQDADRRAARAARERKYQSPEDAAGISAILAMRPTD